MTTISATINKPGVLAIAGYIRVTLTRPATIVGVLVLPASTSFTLDGTGTATFSLAPTVDVNVPYLFEVVQTVPHALDSSTTPPTPAYTEEILLDTFTSVVPDSLTPVTLDALAGSNGIFQDNTDASFVALSRRLFYSDTFWYTLRQQLFNARGIYSSTTPYIRGDLVCLDGASFLCKSPTQVIGVPTTDSTVWFPLATRGATGTGTTGNTTAYDATVWNAQTDAPSRGAVRNVIETLATQTALTTLAPKVSATLTTPTILAKPLAADNSLAIPSTSWVQDALDVLRLSVTPVGTVVSFAGGSAPSKWLLCDGRTVSRTTYAALFAICGTTYNTTGEAGTDFRLPDLRGRSTFAPDTSGVTGAAGVSTAVTAIGTKGGLANKTLAVTEMPSHNHGGNTGGVSAGTDAGMYTSNTNVVTAITIARNASGGASNDYNQHTHAIFSQGGGAAFSILPPFLSMNAIIYAGV